MVKTDQKIQPEPSSKQVLISSCSKKKKYKGVRMRSWGSWVSEIRAPNQKTRIWLGSYSTPEAAARAYDAALLCLKGPSANLNFPITSSSHYIPSHHTIMSPKSIQRVAAAAAANSSPNVDNPATTTTTAAATPPRPSTSSSISPVSSPSLSSSSPSDQVYDDHDVSLIQSLVANNDHHEPNISSMMEPWYSFDQMFNVAPFDPPTMIDDFYNYEEGDIRLWSFC